MNDISILLAFTAGLPSFLSPCVLPLIPAYISYLAGSSIEELKDDKAKLFILYRSLGFVLGFSITFILMGISITSIGKLLITHKDLFRKIEGTLIVIFGLHTIGVFKVKLFYREKRFILLNKIKGPFSSVIMYSLDKRSKYYISYNTWIFFIFLFYYLNSFFYSYNIISYILNG